MPSPRDIPILMSAASVMAILARLKTETRRVVKPQPDHCHRDILDGNASWHRLLPQQGDKEIRCPYGRPGDRLWVREGYAPNCGQASRPGLACGRYRADAKWFYAPNIMCRHPGTYLGRGKSVPSIHMPRWASRITLPRKSPARVERVQAITANACLDEGIDLSAIPGIGSDHSTILAFHKLWDALHAKPKPAKRNPYTGVREACWVSYPWVGLRETREKAGLHWYVVGNPHVWVADWEEPIVAGAEQ